MNLLEIANVPPLILSPESTVLDAVDAAFPAQVGAVAVVKEAKLIGIFTERDLMFKVVKLRKDPATTLIREAMTSPVTHVTPFTPIEDVLELMLKQHFRHVPVSANGSRVDGMLSIRNVLHYMVTHLGQNLSLLESRINENGISG